MMAYLYCKWFHVVFIICWMAGLLYSFRLLIYHQLKGQVSSENHELLSVMERKLLNIITIPGMVLSWVFGLAMIHLQPELMQGKWLHLKLGLVLLLTVSTFYAKQLHKKFAQRDLQSPSQKQLRFINEIPTILMIAIVGLVICKPWL